MTGMQCFEALSGLFSNSLCAWGNEGDVEIGEGMNRLLERYFRFMRVMRLFG